jgi:dihydropyrimidinase
MPPMPVHIINARIVNPDQIFPADILIEDGRIKSFRKHGTLAAQSGVTEIDAHELLVIPAGIDPHVHLSLQTPAGLSADDFVTGSRAAEAGGVKHIIDFVTPRRGQDLVDALRERLQESSGCTTALDFHMGISGMLPDIDKQMEVCVKQYGIRSFKTYLAYRNSIGINFQELEKVMHIAARLDAVVLVHAEDDEMIDSLKRKFITEGKRSPRYHSLSRPPESESNAVAGTIELIRRTGCKTYFVHISSAESADIIAEAKMEGLPVFAETCPQYLVLGNSLYEGDFTATAPYVFSPPPRDSRHRKALWQHILQGTFDTIATDHCPFNMKQKLQGKDDFTMIPNGAGGLEFRLPLIYHYGVAQRNMPLQQWVRLMSTGAAEIFGLLGKGYLKEGAKADIVLFDPRKEWTLSASTQIQNCDICIYEGISVKGKVEHLI